jgi:hypothetical protein
MEQFETDVARTRVLDTLWVGFRRDNVYRGKCSEIGCEGLREEEAAL